MHEPDFLRSRSTYLAGRPKVQPGPQLAAEGCGRPGTIRSGPVILMRAMSTSIRALRWVWLPDATMSAMLSATCRKVAGGGAAGTAATWPASSSRRAHSCCDRALSWVAVEAGQCGYDRVLDGVGV
jgi:hypothetical protein